MASSIGASLVLHEFKNTDLILERGKKSLMLSSSQKELK